MIIKKCEKCGKENPPDAEYCRGCGAKLKSSKQPQNKKVNIRMIIIIIAAAAAAAIIGVFAFMSVGGDRRLQEQLDLGAKYIDELDYEAAAVAYTAAIEIDESCTEAYIGAADAYIGLEDYENAKTILSKGLEKVSGTYVASDGAETDAKDVIQAKIDEIQDIEAEAETVIAAEVAEEETGSALTVEQAYQGVYNYLEAQGFDFDEVYEYNGYLTAGETSDSEYTVIFKSYTGAFQYFYVNKETGYTYITEYVPLIVDEETDTGVSFYIWDYLSDNAAVASESLDDEAAATWEVIQKYGISDYGFNSSAGYEPYMVFYIDEDSIEDCGDYYSATVRLEYGLEMTSAEVQDLEAGDEITLETNSIEGEEETTTFVCYDGLDNPFYNGYEGICLVKKGIEYNESSAYFPVEDEQTGKVGFHGEIHDEYIRQIFYKGKLRIKKDALYCENMLVSGIWSEQDEERHYAENIWKNDGYDYDYEGYETFKTFSVSDLSQDYNSGFNYVGFTDDGYVIILSNVYS